jgi:hypothetical protein
MAEWLGLIGALAGTGIGGYVTYKVGEQRYKHERQSDRDERTISACEAIHELLSTISSQGSQLNLGVVGQLGYGAKIQSDLLKEKVQLDRLQMLVDFYVPSLHDDVEAIATQLTVIGRCVSETVLKQNPTEEWKTKIVESSVLASIELTKLAQAAQKKLAISFRALS